MNFQLFALNGMSASDLLTQRVSGYSSDASVAAQQVDTSNFRFILL